MYKITWLEDSHDCEMCGTDYAAGYVIYKNDVLVIDKTPFAHCFDGDDYSSHSPYADILELEGIVYKEDQSYGGVENQLEIEE